MYNITTDCFCGTIFDRHKEDTMLNSTKRIIITTFGIHKDLSILNNNFVDQSINLNGINLYNKLSTKYCVIIFF